MAGERCFFRNRHITSRTLIIIPAYRRLPDGFVSTYAAAAPYNSRKHLAFCEHKIQLLQRAAIAVWTRSTLYRPCTDKMFNEIRSGLANVPRGSRRA